MSFSNNIIVNLNVGGTRFTTSRGTLTWIPDSFFTSLLSGRIPTLLDESGAIFIDRDPQIFSTILNYLRTKQINIKNVDVFALKHEAQFYGLSPLVRRLILCDELEQSSCGDVLFHAYLPSPQFPPVVTPAALMIKRNANSSNGDGAPLTTTSDVVGGRTQTSINGSNTLQQLHTRNASDPPLMTSQTDGGTTASHTLPMSSSLYARPNPIMDAKFQVPSVQCSDLPNILGNANFNKPSPPCKPEDKVVVKTGSSESELSWSSSNGSSIPAAQLSPLTVNIASVHGDAQNANVPLVQQKDPSTVATLPNAPQFGSSATAAGTDFVKPTHHRSGSADWKPWKTHSKSRGSSDLTRLIKQELLATLKQQQDFYTDPHRVKMIRAHHSWIAVAYQHHIACYKSRDSVGWYLVYLSSRLDAGVEQIALNARQSASAASGALAPGIQAPLGVMQPPAVPTSGSSEKLLAAALADHSVVLWAVSDDGNATCLGVFGLNNAPLHALLFVGGQLITLSRSGQVGIWHGVTQNWQVQDVLPISSYDTAGSFLLLGCTNGSIYYIDMQKFPLRMKDNDLLVTELYRDPSADPITSISVYLTPKSSLCGNWIEIAYGTNSGSVRVIVQHPETVGHGPQLFQTFSVHRASITKVTLTTNHLISVCSEYNHVRTWTVTRFRGMISTQPGSTPLASFKVLSLDPAQPSPTRDALLNAAADVGPFGEQDSDKVFVQKLVPETTQLFVRLASNGERICVVKSADESSVTCFLVHECDGSSRMGARPRRFLFTGHVNGSIQMWDLATALDMHNAAKEKGEKCSLLQGPTAEELLRVMDECEITCNSLSATPTTSTTPANSSWHIPALFPATTHAGCRLRHHVVPTPATGDDDSPLPSTSRKMQ